MAKTWGTEVVPREDWIDLDATYRTRSGKVVTGLRMVLNNLQGEEVTFPVKGSIIEKHRVPRYQIWTLLGESDLFNETPDDLILQSPQPGESE